MTDTTTTTPHYRTPVVYAEAEVSLDEFDTDDIINYLKHNGHSFDGSSSPSEPTGNGLVINQESLNRIETLVLCGQKQHAHQLIFTLISEAISRNIE